MNAADLRAALRCDRPRCACGRARASVTHCPTHADRSPSLGVDERGHKTLVFCRAGCRQDEVIQALRDRGLWPSSSTAGEKILSHSLEEARRRVLAEAKRQPWACEGTALLYEIADWLRLTRRKVSDLWALGATCTDEGEQLEILGRAARLETFTHSVEFELDEILGKGRVA